MLDLLHCANKTLGVGIYAFEFGVGIPFVR